MEEFMIAIGKTGRVRKIKSCFETDTKCQQWVSDLLSGIRMRGRSRLHHSARGKDHSNRSQIGRQHKGEEHSSRLMPSSFPQRTSASRMERKTSLSLPRFASQIISYTFPAIRDSSSSTYDRRSDGCIFPGLAWKDLCLPGIFPCLWKEAGSLRRKRKRPSL